MSLGLTQFLIKTYGLHNAGEVSNLASKGCCVNPGVV